MIEYQLPEGVEAIQLEERPVLTTSEGGKVAIDIHLLSLWKFAQGKELGAILRNYQNREEEFDLLRAELCCLSEAGLLTRTANSQSESEEYFEYQGKLISVIIVAYNSKDWLIESLPSLLAQTYHPLELILVDNGSLDQSAEWAKAKYPDLTVIRLETPCAFSKAINTGINQARGDYFLLLNPDVFLQSDAIEQLFVQFQEKKNCAAVGAKLKLLWAPAFLNGIGNRVGAFSWGTDNGIGHLDLGQFDQWTEIPSLCFAAALISRKTWETIGPVDEGFPMYYEDAEWSYRARILGYKIYAAPQAVIYHAFGGRIPDGRESDLEPVKLRNVVYGRLRFTLKLLDSNLIRFMINYLIEDITNLLRSFFSWKWINIRMILKAWYGIINDLSEILASRSSLKNRRAISDRELFSLQSDMPVTLTWRGLPELSSDIIQNLYLPAIISRRTRPMPEFDNSTRRTRILVVSHDIVDVKMAGPGMRYLEIARVLSHELDVILAIPSESSLIVPGVRMIRYWEDRPTSLQILAENSDVILVSGYMVEKFPFLSNSGARIVVDLYDPFVLENLFYYFDEPLADQERLNNHSIRITNQLANLGDYFICGNERQRDYWMGVLTATGRVNPNNYINDPTLRKLIDIVGIGIPDRELITKEFLKGNHELIPKDARIILWGGGIWNWLDPLTLVKAWPRVIVDHPEARLVFLGTRHPNPMVPKHKMAAKTEEIAQEIGEMNKTILFIEWLSYEDREALLSEADIGVALHPIHLETRYSLRTRVLDYLWAKIPILVTEGDITSEWVRSCNLGIVVPPFDIESVAKGLIELLDQPRDVWSHSFEPIRASLRWSSVVEPLQKYCQFGDYAPDRERRIKVEEIPDAPWLSTMIARARSIQRNEGTRTMLHRAWRHLQWRLSR
jgi:GT2 family glycosyltransferase